MITVFFPQTSVAIFHRRRPINGGQIATMAQCCSHTDYPILCNFMLKPLRSGTCEQATMAAIRATILQVNQAKAFVARQKAKVSQKKQELDVCLEVYDSAIYDLKTSLTNLMSRPELLLSSLSAAMGDISTCDDALNESGVVSPERSSGNTRIAVGSLNLDLVKEHERYLTPWITPPISLPA
ncbi:hypothetical protein NE237_020138 [Protea cynaroides]|uniref:Pectinesterase inhibitor domain-containing protein n=1 Tax=Protea cynaroides TaxID=273540 RepID=A0A9Q0K3L2_9MAGN|nr:hypothetical protein NE237_020138 [Protea cynaroides]